MQVTGDKSLAVNVEDVTQKVSDETTPKKKPEDFFSDLFSGSSNHPMNSSYGIGIPASYGSAIYPSY